MAKEEKKIVDMVIKAYVEVMGAAKWNSLTADQQHDVIMIMVQDMLKALD